MKIEITSRLAQDILNQLDYHGLKHLSDQFKHAIQQCCTVNGCHDCVQFHVTHAMLNQQQVKIADRLIKIFNEHRGSNTAVTAYLDQFLQTPVQTIIQQLWLDELDQVQIVMGIEDQFNICIKLCEDLFERCRTMYDVVMMIDKKLGDKDE